MADHAPRRGGLTAVTGGGEGQWLYPVRVIEAEAIEAGRRLFAREARFVAGAAEPTALPAERLPEIAFAGRSNVGKSSLINALTTRRMLARISNTPGRTRQLNFFDLGSLLMLVDLPGYGYAEASKLEIERWTALVRRYLQARAALRQVCLLIDARHGIKPPDRPILQLLDRAGVSYKVVLTKVDKLRADEPAACAARVAAELSAHVAAHPEIHLTSAEKGRGIAALRASIAEFAPSGAAVAMAASPPLAID